MKIERLSENQIRCTLNKADLTEKQLKISELAYGTPKAKELFKDMMQQASVELGFEADDTPLMIEAIPVSPDCLILIVTRLKIRKNWIHAFPDSQRPANMILMTMTNTWMMMT